MSDCNETLQMTYSNTATMERVTEVYCRMKRFLLKVWWRNTATRIFFPLVFFAIGISIFTAFEDNNIASNIGMAFIVIALITFVIGFNYEIHKSARDVDEVMREREEREKGEGKRK